LLIIGLDYRATFHALRNCDKVAQILKSITHRTVSQRTT